MAVWLSFALANVLVVLLALIASRVMIDRGAKRISMAFIGLVIVISVVIGVVTDIVSGISMKLARYTSLKCGLIQERRGKSGHIFEAP